MKTLQELIDKHKPLHIQFEYNRHKFFHESIDISYADEMDDFIDKEEYEECVRTDTTYVLQVYTRTSIGSYTVIASTLEKALEVMDNSISLEK